MCDVESGDCDSLDLVRGFGNGSLDSFFIGFTRVIAGDLSSRSPSKCFCLRCKCLGRGVLWVDHDELLSFGIDYVGIYDEVDTKCRRIACNRGRRPSCRKESTMIVIGISSTSLPRRICAEVCSSKGRGGKRSIQSTGYPGFIDLNSTSIFFSV